MIRNGVSAEGVPPPPEQALSAPAPAAAAASLPKARRLRGWLLVDILVLVSLRYVRVAGCVRVVGGPCRPRRDRAGPTWSNW
ncbi:hypothetical protein [Streptomyces sp. NPDC059258]|uniref:hypothetical protein n=1 Tax=unclassified Streptomyces TaxID=2593676 RepID=UPI0036A747F5